MQGSEMVEMCLLKMGVKDKLIPLGVKQIQLSHTFLLEVQCNCVCMKANRHCVLTKSSI